MKKTFFLLFAILLYCTAGFGQIQQYSRIHVPATAENIKVLVQNSIPTEPGIIEDGFIVLELPHLQKIKLQELNVQHEVIIEDLAHYYAERNKDVTYEIERAAMDEYPVPEGWELGSMGGMYTYEEVLAELDTMRQLYPTLISELYQIGDHTSVEGRPMNWIRISDNPEVNEDEPEVLYTALHHAREGIGVQQMIFYMYYLLENYNSDTTIQGLVNGTEMYFVPFVNPDGYVYNETWYPNGGGLWRKNRRDNGDGSYGIDLNRNYGYMWGYDNYGSSPYPEEDTYRGTEAFSEPETQAIRDFSNNNEFKITLNYHSYGNYLLYPWGYISATTEDDDIFRLHSQMMTQENNCVYGAGGVELYRTNGGSDDWMYGEQNAGPKIFAYTPEVGSGSDGFWPPIQNILPLCRQNMHQNIMAARLSGHYAKVRDISPFAIGALEGNFSFSIKRLGLSNGGSYTVSIEPLNDAIIATGDTVSFSGLDILEEQEGEISYELRSGLITGDEISYLLKISNGFITDEDTITKMFGQPIVLFEDDCNTFENWNGSWYITTEDYFSPPASITDSPSGNYSNNMFYLTTLEPEIDLSSTMYAELSYRARWDVTPDDDWVQIIISTDDGTSWEPLAGRFTRTSDDNIIPGQPFYDGIQPDWVKEIIPLNQFLNESVKFRFILRSNGSENADGFYFDDFTVSILPDITNVEEVQLEENLIKVIPNPATGQVRFFTPEEGQLQVFDAQGKLIFSGQSDHPTEPKLLDISNWQMGLYLYTFTGKGISTSGKLLVQ